MTKAEDTALAPLYSPSLGQAWAHRAIQALRPENVARMKVFKFLFKRIQKETLSPCVYAFAAVCPILRKSP